MKLYFIRHKPSGLFIQRAPGIRGKGGNDMDLGSSTLARPFFSRRGVTGFLNNWLKVWGYRRADFETITKEIEL